MRVLITGIGRSGTTLIYRQIAALLHLTRAPVESAYEPYLWSTRSRNVKGSRFGMQDVSARGVYVHTSTPLFLDGRDDLHDAFIDSLFGSHTAQGAPAPNAWVAKVIRGSGRLRAFLTRIPDLKVVACLRNPLETINSSLGMFSLFGEEFHQSDKPRFRKELGDRGLGDLLPGESLTQFQWSVAWWRAFTEATLQVAREFPDRVHLLPYEVLIEKGPEAVAELCRFLDGANPGDFSVGIEQSAGPTIKPVYLLPSDVEDLYPHLEYYQASCLAHRLVPDTIRALEDKVVQKLSSGQLTPQLAAHPLGCESPIQLRNKLLYGHSAKEQINKPLGASDNGRINLLQLVRESAIAPATPRRSERLERGPGRKTFGCVITNFNNGYTIEDAIYSALNQTRPFDRIVVVDDRSTDGSIERVQRIVEQHSRLTFLQLSSNTGVSAARDFGIRALDTDFVTQLDGDDCFWPSKNYTEAAVAEASPNSVVFSDFLVLAPTSTRLVDTSHYEGPAARANFALLSRKGGIPRDMTFPRDAYFEAGGYDLRMSLYEDWDLKLRLSRNSRLTWKRAGTELGTVYNRQQPGLSKQSEFAHVRALTWTFLKNVRGTAYNRANLSQAFRTALENHQHQLTDTLALWLLSEEHDPLEVPNLGVLSRFLTRQVLCSSDADFRKQALAHFKLRTRTSWQPGEGFGSKEGPRPGYRARELYWKLAEEAVFDINLNAATKGFKVMCHLHPGEHTLKFCLGDDKREIVVKAARLQDQQTVDVDFSLAEGRNRVRVISSQHVVERRGGVPSGRLLYFIMSGVQA